MTELLQSIAKNLEFTMEKLPNVLGLQNGNAVCCSFDLDGRRMAVGYTDGRIYMVDMETKTTQKVVAAHNIEVTSISWSPCGHLIASSSEDARVCLWEVKTMKRLSTLRYKEPVQEVAYNPTNGKQLIVQELHSNRIIMEFSLPERSLDHNFIDTFEHDRVATFTFNKEGTVLLVAMQSKKLVVYTVKLQKLSKRYRIRMSIMIQQFIVPQNHEFIFVLSDEGNVRAYDEIALLTSGSLHGDTANHVCRNYTEMNLNEMKNLAPWAFAAMDSDGKYICGAEESTSSLAFWELEHILPVKSILIPKDAVLRDMRWNPSKKQIIVITNGEVTMYSCKEDDGNNTNPKPSKYTSEEMLNQYICCCNPTINEPKPDDQSPSTSGSQNASSDSDPSEDVSL